MKNAILSLFILFFVASCTTPVDDVIPEPVDAKPIALKSALQKRVAQDNQFAFELLRQTISSSGENNVTVSPISVSLALGMTLNGASGETKSQIENALFLSGLNSDEINEYYKVMQTNLPLIDPLTKLSLANSIWYDKNFQVKSNFLNVNAENFNAYVKALDFKQSWAKDTINNWCNKNTKGLIPTIIDQISNDAVLYLVNAVYFKGVWRLKFDKKLTHEAEFTNAAGKTNTVNFMKQDNTFGYYADENAQYVDLEYGNKAFSMTIMLPNEGKTTQDVLTQLNSEKWTGIINGLYSKDMILYLPRFKSENKFELNAALTAMGMPVAFTDLADFSNIANNRLSISQILHKTYIAVDEEGTEAAAVTSVEFVTTSMPVKSEIRINKPFVYAIREKSTGVVLFTGKIGDIQKY